MSLADWDFLPVLRHGHFGTNCRRGMHFKYLEGYFVPNPSFSSLNVVHDFPSILFLYPFTTCLVLPDHLIGLNSVVGHVLLLGPVLGGAFSGHTFDTYHHSCLKVARGLGENCRNFWCNVGATQPLGIYLPPPSHKSTQLYGFSIFNSVRYFPCNRSPSFPSLFPPPSLSHHCSEQWIASTRCAELKCNEMDCI